MTEYERGYIDGLTARQKLTEEGTSDAWIADESDWCVNILESTQWCWNNGSLMNITPGSFRLPAHVAEVLCYLGKAKFVSTYK